MKKLRLLLIGSYLLLLTTAISFAQDGPEYIDLPADEYPAYVTPSSSSVTSTDMSDREKSKMIENIIGIILFTSILGHMIYIKYVRTPRFKVVFTPQHFIDKRIAGNMEQQMSDQEGARCTQLFDEIEATWDKYEEEGEEFHTPTSYKQLKVATKAIEEIIAMSPTNEDIIEQINGYANVVNLKEKRSFLGSKMLMILASAFAIVPVFFDSWVQFFPLMFGVVLYYLACQKPVFLAEKKAGKVGVDRSFMWGVWDMAFSGKTYIITWRNSKGDERKERDSTEWWLTFFFGMILIVMFSMMISLWAVVAYIRNYIIYK